MSQTIVNHLSIPIVSTAIAAAISVSFALPSQATTNLFFSGDTTNGPTFNRPETAGYEGGTNPPTALSSNGTDVSYSSQPFSVDTSGIYNIVGSQNFEAIQYLYQTSFDPSAPLTNIVSGDDPFPDEGTASFLRIPLTANQTYFLVTTAFDSNNTPSAPPFPPFPNTSFGTFTNTITFVPEPTDIGGVILVGLGYSLLKRKRK